MSAIDVILRTGDTHAVGQHPSCLGHGNMRALALIADRQLAVADISAPPPPGTGEVHLRVKAGAFAAPKHAEGRQVFGKIVVGF